MKYGKLIGYSVNDGKSVSQVHLPEISGNKEVDIGYMGHDEMAIVENSFCQRFPSIKMVTVIPIQLVECGRYSINRWLNFLLLIIEF